jgi:heme A synthase
MATEDRKSWLVVLILSIIGVVIGIFTATPNIPLIVASTLGIADLVVIILILVIAVIKIFKK